MSRRGREERNDDERHEKRKGNRQRASPDRKDGLALEAAPASGRRPQRSRDDRPGRHQADPDHHQQRPGRDGRRGPTAAEWVPRSGAGDGEQPNDSDGRNDGARWWAAKLDEASDGRS